MRIKFLIFFTLACTNFLPIYCMSEEDINKKAAIGMAVVRESLLAYVKNAIENKVDLSVEYTSAETGLGPMYCAILHDQNDILEMLLKYGANPNPHYCPLLHAIMLKRKKATKLLLEYGADTNLTGNNAPCTAMEIAEYYKEYEIVKILKFFENKEKSFQLFAAIQENNLLKLRFFLKKDFVNPNIQNEKGETPLHVAILAEDFEAIIHLLANGANICMQNKSGQTPVHYAADRLKILKFLMSFEDLKKAKKVVEVDFEEKKHNEKKDSLIIHNYELQP